MAKSVPKARRNHCVLLLVLVTFILAATLIMGNYQYEFQKKLFSAGGVRVVNTKPIDSEKADEQFDMTPVHSEKPDKLSINLVTSPYLDYERASDSQVLERHEEYRKALQRNLNHRFIERVHTLTTNATDMRRRLRVEALSNYSKLVVVEVKSVYYFRDIWEYISQNLVDKDAMYSNADTYLGDGFQLVDPRVMAKEKIMYSLTRQEAPDQKCHRSDLCVGWKYIGSHDGFLFRLTEPLPEKALHELEFHLSNWGMENVLMWIFKDMLKFCLLNPCRTLQVFHLHCSDLRNSHERTRVNINGKSGTAPFTNALVCSSTKQ